MATLKDYQDRTVTGALREVPDPWFTETLRDGGFCGYRAGVGSTTWASVQHCGTGWEWSLYICDSLADRSMKPCRTALQAVRAVQRAANRAGYRGRF